MTAINLQMNDIECPHCKSTDTEYIDSSYYPTHTIEAWECNECKEHFEVKCRTEILEIY